MTAPTDPLDELVDATLALARALDPSPDDDGVEQRVRTWRQALRVSLLACALLGPGSCPSGSPGEARSGRRALRDALAAIASPTAWFAVDDSPDHLPAEPLERTLDAVGHEWLDSLPRGLTIEDTGRLLAPALQHAADWPRSTRRGHGGLQRKRRGSYFTPPALIDALLDELQALPGDPNGHAEQICDPACGAGALLLAVARRRAARGIPRDDILRGLHGVDVDPLAVELCRLSLYQVAPVSVPVSVSVFRASLETETGTETEPEVGGDADLRATLVAHIQHGNALVGQPPPGVAATEPLPPVPPGLTPFDWPVRVPGLAERGGFDLVLANPPWMRIKAQARHLLRATLPDAARAAHRAERQRTLDSDAPELRDALTRRRDVSRALSGWLRSSGCFPRSAHGDINTFALFTERCWQLVAPGGRVGLIVPTGLATDHGHRHLFAELVDRGAVHALLDFENRQRLFPGVDSRFRFSLVALHRPAGDTPARRELRRVATLLHHPDERHADGRTWSIDADALVVCNPDSRTLPMFRTATSARRGIAMQRRHDTLGAAGARRWDVDLRRMFDMTNDADAFVTREALEADGLDLRDDPRHGLVMTDDRRTFVPLYEGKLFWQHQGAFATFAGQPADARRRGRTGELASGAAVVEPRFWVDAAHLRDKVEPALLEEARFWLCVRALTNPTNQRTLVAALVPPCAVGNSALVVEALALARSAGSRRRWLPLLCANLNALVLDDLARQKMGNTNVNMYMLRQLPVLQPSDWETAPWPGAPPLGALVAPRALGLAASCGPMAGQASEPVWDRPVPALETPGARARAVAEIDALVAHGYGLGESDLRAILEPEPPEVAFGALERAERAEHGRFVTAERTLEAFRTLRAWAR